MEHRGLSRCGVSPATSFASVARHGRGVVQVRARDHARVAHVGKRRSLTAGTAKRDAPTYFLSFQWTDPRAHGGVHSAR